MATSVRIVKPTETPTDAWTDAQLKVFYVKKTKNGDVNEKETAKAVRQFRNRRNNRAFYYRHTEPGVDLKYGFTEDEIDTFIEEMDELEGEVPVWTDYCANFPGHWGFQYGNLYDKLVKAGKIENDSRKVRPRAPVVVEEEETSSSDDDDEEDDDEEEKPVVKTPAPRKRAPPKKHVKASEPKRVKPTPAAYSPVRSAHPQPQLQLTPTFPELDLERIPGPPYHQPRFEGDEEELGEHDVLVNWLDQMKQTMEGLDEPSQQQPPASPVQTVPHDDATLPLPEENEEQKPPVATPPGFITPETLHAQEPPASSPKKTSPSPKKKVVVEEEEEEKPPMLANMIDSLTGLEMRRPTICPCGHVLDRDTWFKVCLRNKACPFTNKPLTFRQCEVITPDNAWKYKSKIVENPRFKEKKNPTAEEKKILIFIASLKQ